MKHRHLVGGRMSLAELDDIIERGTAADWRPILGMVSTDPWGDVAERILHLVAASDRGSQGVFWRSYILAKRGDTTDRFAPGGWRERRANDPAFGNAYKAGDALPGRQLVER